MRRPEGPLDKRAVFSVMDVAKPRAKGGELEYPARDPRTWFLGHNLDLASVSAELSLPAASFDAIALIRTAGIAIARLEARHWTRFGLRSSAGWVLVELYLKGPTRPADLAASLLVTPGGMSQVISALEKKGLVTRARDQTDRRCTPVLLTPEGKQIVESQLPDMRESLGHIERAFGAFRLTLLSRAVGELLGVLHSATEEADEKSR